MSTSHKSLLPLPCARRRAFREGFTLVEIMITLAIIASAMAVILAMRGNSLKSIQGIERAAMAQGIAERLLAERLAADTKYETTEEGQVDGAPGFAYAMAVREISQPKADRQEGKDAPREAAKDKPRLYEIQVTVTFKDYAEQRSFTLTTQFYDQPALRAQQEQPK